MRTVALWPHTYLSHLLIDSIWQAWQDKVPQTLVDVGTGAGFPGIVLKILYPRLKLTLVESVGKKTTFCQHIVDSLHLDNVTVIQARAEALGQQARFREAFDWAVARAVASSLLDLQHSYGGDGRTPSAHEVDGDHRYAGLAPG